MTATLQQLLDAFSADVKAYIDQEVARRTSGHAIDSVADSVSSGSVSAELEELESILNEFKQSSSENHTDHQIDDLLASLEAFGEKEANLPTDTHDDALGLLRSFHIPREKSLDKHEAVDFYIEKLSTLNSVSDSDTMKPGNKPVGIAYALELLQRYKQAALTK